MTEPVEWLKATHCNHNACVEVGAGGDAILIRDSKNPGGPRLSVSADAFASMLDFARSGGLDVLLRSS